jgi:hypothetical protein
MAAYFAYPFRRGGRHPLPSHIETQTITIEPDLDPEEG